MLRPRPIEPETEVAPPRSRRLLAIVAVIVPVIILAGGAAWFIRAHLMPPMIAISEPVTVASVGSTGSAQPAPETTGASQPPAAPTARFTNNTAEIWASVPLPAPPRTTQPAAPAFAPAEPVATSVPLPLPKPRLSVATANGNGPVPLPRPRPAIN